MLNLKTPALAGVILLLLSFANAQELVSVGAELDPGIASLTNTFEFSNGEAQSFIVAAYQSETMLEASDIDLRDTTSVELALGLYLTPIFGSCMDNPTLFTYIEASGEQRRANTRGNGCYELGDNRLFEYDLDVQASTIELDTWYAIKAVEIFSNELETSEEASNYISFYIYFSSQAAPETPDQYPAAPEVQTVSDIEQLALK